MQLICQRSRLLTEQSLNLEIVSDPRRRLSFSTTESSAPSRITSFFFFFVFFFYLYSSLLFVLSSHVGVSAVFGPPADGRRSVLEAADGRSSEQEGGGSAGTGPSTTEPGDISTETGKKTHQGDFI